MSIYTFVDYIERSNKKNLHPKIDKLYKGFSDNIKDLPNIIFYGPPGTGKYTQMLKLVSRFSPSTLKHEKKITMDHDKHTFNLKISDIHYEIDMSLLGCNAKLMWHDIYKRINDIILSSAHKIGIIVCKNFGAINNDLLDIFYNFRKTQINSHITLKYILICESIGFIPDDIIHCSIVVPVVRPSRSKLEQTFKINKDIQLDKITNMKNIHLEFKTDKCLIASDTLYKLIIDNKSFSFSGLREHIYSILINNLNLEECIWIITEKLINGNNIKSSQLNELMENVYIFFKQYNNNYRSIFHLEKIIIDIIRMIKT